MSVGTSEFGLLALAPSAVTVLVAVAARRVSWALLAGVACGAGVVAADFQVQAAAQQFLGYLLGVVTCPEQLKMVLFILLLGGLLEILFVSGAVQCLAEALSRFVHSARQARLATWLMGLCLSFDDHAEVLLTGTAMRSLLQRHRVDPALLAYLCSTLAGAASVTFLSTWFVYQIALIAQAAANIGVEHSATALFLASWPYHLPTFLALFLALLVAYTGRGFGPLGWPTPAGGQSPERVRGTDARCRHAGVPLLALAGSLVAGLLAGGYWSLPSDSYPQAGLSEYLGAAPVLDSLLGATALAVALCLGLLLKDRVLPARVVYRGLGRGVQGMAAVGVIILLAQALSRVIADLNTGAYLVMTVQASLGPATLPVGAYAVTLLLSVATGSSWSAMALVMPMAFQLAAALECTESLPLIAAAVICGSLSLAPVIPYSDTVMITAAVCGLSPLAQTRLQWPQVRVIVPLGLGAFLLLGLSVPLGAVYLIALSGIGLLHFTFARPIPDWPRRGISPGHGAQTAAKT